jgi:hypothetical protein
MRQALLVAVFVCLMTGSPGWAATTYTYTTIDPKPEWNALHLFIHGIDDLGKIVGETIEADGVTARSFRYVPGVAPDPMMRWNIPKNLPKGVRDINNRGWVLQLVAPDATSIQVWWCDPAKCKTLPIPGGDPIADRLTNSGHAIGAYAADLPEFPDGEAGRLGYIYDLVTNKLQSLQWPGAKETYLTGLTDDGVYVGFAQTLIGEHPFVVSFHGWDGHLFEFTPIPGTVGNQLIAINDRLQLVGLAFYETDILSFVTTPSGEFLEIDYPGSQSTFVAEINNRGVVAGSYLNAAGFWRGFLASPQHVAAATTGLAMEADPVMTDDLRADVTADAEPLRERRFLDRRTFRQICDGAQWQYRRVLPACRSIGTGAEALQGR